MGLKDGQPLGFDVVGDSDGISVVGKEGTDGAGGNVVGPFVVGLGGVAVGRQPHGSEIASARSCAPTHSDCVNSELSPACSTSKH